MVPPYCPRSRAPWQAGDSLNFERQVVAHANIKKPMDRTLNLISFGCCVHLLSFLVADLITRLVLYA